MTSNILTNEKHMLFLHHCRNWGSFKNTPKTQSKTKEILSISKNIKNQILPNSMNNTTVFPFIFDSYFFFSRQILQHQIQKKNWFSFLSKKDTLVQSVELYLKLIFFLLCYKINETYNLNMNLNQRKWIKFRGLLLEPYKSGWFSVTYLIRKSFEIWSSHECCHRNKIWNAWKVI